MELVAGLPGLLSLLSGAGPIAVTVATAFVAVIAALILSSRVREILAGTKAVEQSAQFQGTMLEVIKMLREDEVRLRTRISSLEADNSVLRDDVLEMKMTLSLIRNQRRRLIASLREAMRTGHVRLDALDPADAVVPA